MFGGFDVGEGDGVAEDFAVVREFGLGGGDEAGGPVDAGEDHDDGEEEAGAIDEPLDAFAPIIEDPADEADAHAHDYVTAEAVVGELDGPSGSERQCYFRVCLGEGPDGEEEEGAEEAVEDAEERVVGAEFGDGLRAVFEGPEADGIAGVPPGEGDPAFDGPLAVGFGEGGVGVLDGGDADGATGVFGAELALDDEAEVGYAAGDDEEG